METQSDREELQPDLSFEKYQDYYVGQFFSKTMTLHCMYLLCDALA